MLNNTQPSVFGDEEVEDELPGYDAETAPLYNQLDFLPIWTYHLRQVNRKLQILVPFGPTCDTSYKIFFRTTLNLLSKESDITLNCVSPKLSEEITVATTDFSNDGPLPWCPRATFRCNIMNTELAKTYYMEARNFSDWKVSIGEVSFFWRLEDRPFTLVFSEGSSRVAIARFYLQRVRHHCSKRSRGWTTGDISPQSFERQRWPRAHHLQLLRRHHPFQENGATLSE